MDFAAYDKALSKLKTDLAVRLLAFENETGTRVSDISVSSYVTEMGSRYPCLVDIDISVQTREGLLVKK